MKESGRNWLRRTGAPTSRDRRDGRDNRVLSHPRTNEHSTGGKFGMVKTSKPVITKRICIQPIKLPGVEALFLQCHPFRGKSAKSTPSPVHRASPHSNVLQVHEGQVPSPFFPAVAGIETLSYESSPTWEDISDPRPGRMPYEHGWASLRPNVKHQVSNQDLLRPAKKHLQPRHPLFCHPRDSRFVCSRFFQVEIPGSFVNADGTVPF